MEKLEISELNIKYTYGALAVSDLSFSAKNCEITCIYGDAESGKTSLLKCLAGLIKITSGNIFIDGKNINELNTKDRDVILIFEDGTFFENKTVRYNLIYPLKIRNYDQESIEKKIDDTFKKLDINVELLDKKMKKLSASERVDVVFARAYLRQAGLVLIDDPFKKLGDARKAYFEKYSEIIKEMSNYSVVIYATNNVSDCFYFGATTVFLNYGICIQQGKPEEIKFNPNSLLSLKHFNDSFVIFDGIIEKDNELYLLRYNGKSFNLDKKKLISDIYIGKDILIVEYSADKMLILDKDNERIIYFS